MNKKDMWATLHRFALRATRPMDRVSFSLLVVSGVLLILTWILSNFDQPIGTVFLGVGLTIATVLCYFWYQSNPDAGWRDFWKFFSLVAANVILFVLFGFLVLHDPAAGVVFFGLFVVVFSYSIWPIFSPDSGHLGLTLDNL